MMISAKEKDKAGEWDSELGVGYHFGQGQPQMVSLRRWHWVRHWSRCKNRECKYLKELGLKGRPQVQEKTHIFFLNVKRYFFFWLVSQNEEKKDYLFKVLIH